MDDVGNSFFGKLTVDFNDWVSSVENEWKEIVGDEENEKSPSEIYDNVCKKISESTKPVFEFTGKVAEGFKKLVDTTDAQLTLGRLIVAANGMLIALGNVLEENILEGAINYHIFADFTKECKAAKEYNSVGNPARLGHDLHKDEWWSKKNAENKDGTYSILGVIENLISIAKRICNITASVLGGIEFFQKVKWIEDFAVEIGTVSVKAIVALASSILSLIGNCFQALHNYFDRSDLELKREALSFKPTAKEELELKGVDGKRAAGVGRIDEVEIALDAPVAADAAKKAELTNKLEAKRQNLMLKLKIESAKLADLKGQKPVIQILTEEDKAAYKNASYLELKYEMACLKAERMYHKNEAELDKLLKSARGMKVEDREAVLPKIGALILERGRLSNEGEALQRIKKLENKDHVVDLGLFSQYKVYEYRTSHENLNISLTNTLIDSISNAFKVTVLSLSVSVDVVGLSGVTEAFGGDDDKATQLALASVGLGSALFGVGQFYHKEYSQKEKQAMSFAQFAAVDLAPIHHQPSGKKERIEVEVD